MYLGIRHGRYTCGYRSSVGRCVSRDLDLGREQSKHHSMRWWCRMMLSQSRYIHPMLPRPYPSQTHQHLHRRHQAHHRRRLDHHRQPHRREAREDQAQQVLRRHEVSEPTFIKPTLPRTIEHYKTGKRLSCRFGKMHIWSRDENTEHALVSKIIHTTCMPPRHFSAGTK